MSAPELAVALPPALMAAALVWQAWSGLQGARIDPRRASLIGKRLANVPAFAGSKLGSV